MQLQVRRKEEKKNRTFVFRIIVQVLHYIRFLIGKYTHTHTTTIELANQRRKKFFYKKKIEKKILSGQ